MLQRIKKDDTRAFQLLFNRYWEKLYVFAFGRLRSKPEAEDVVQHVFMKIWEHRAARNITFSLRHYLYKAVSYEVIAAVRRLMDTAKDIDLVNENILPVFNTTLEKMTVGELEALIELNISQLPQRMQEIFRLSREEELTVREIAVRLDLSEQTVKNQLTVALGRLRKPLVQSLLLLLFLELTMR